MKLLVYPHDLAIGGSQINAIDLAAAVAERGADVVVYGLPGPLTAYVEQKGLRYVPARPLRYRPAPSRAAQLAQLVRAEGIDLVHAYEWPPCLDAFYGPHLVHRTALLCTVLSMAVSPLVPRSVPLVMGTPDLQAAAARSHAAPVHVLEPPIDVDGDHPGLDGSAFRSAHRVREDEQLVVSVSRLAVDLKLDALVRAIDAVDALAARRPVRLVLVGGGEAHGHLLQRAAAVNRRHGREVVSLPGPDPDPRPAYAAADVVLGMGSSALRAMAIGKPVIVQGERGFSLEAAPEHEAVFLRQGFWGIGDDPADVERLSGQLDALLADAGQRQRLGAFGRTLVTERFALGQATDRLLTIYEDVLAAPSAGRRPVGEAWRAGRLAMRNEVELHDPRRKQARRRDALERLEAARRRRSHGLTPAVHHPQEASV